MMSLNDVTLNDVMLMNVTLSQRPHSLLVCRKERVEELVALLI
jgi:hypothetical protein